MTRITPNATNAASADRSQPASNATENTAETTHNTASQTNRAGRTAARAQFANLPNVPTLDMWQRTPIVSRISVIHHPRIGRKILMEGHDLQVTPQPGVATPPVTASYSTNRSDLSDDIFPGERIRCTAIQVKPLKPFVSSRDGTKALFNVPEGPLPDDGTTTVSIKLGGKLQNMDLSNEWLQPEVTPTPAIADEFNQATERDTHQDETTRR